MKISKNNVQTCVSLVLSSVLLCGSAYADRSLSRYERKNPATQEQKKLTPNEELILAVKGVKLGAALLAGLFNPVLGIVIASSPNTESSSDLLKIDRLLAKGADIDCREDHSEYTPLIYAAYYGYPEITNHLLSKGADAQLKDKDGYNAYTMAQYYLNRYTSSSVDNEKRKLEKDFTEEKRAEMREYYREMIDRYQAVVNILEPVTFDHTMPRCSWF